MSIKEKIAYDETIVGLREELHARAAQAYTNLRTLEKMQADETKVDVAMGTFNALSNAADSIERIVTYSEEGENNQVDLAIDDWKLKK